MKWIISTSSVAFGFIYDHFFQHCLSAHSSSVLSDSSSTEFTSLEEKKISCPFFKIKMFLLQFHLHHHRSLLSLAFFILNRIVRRIARWMSDCLCSIEDYNIHLYVCTYDAACCRLPRPTDEEVSIRKFFTVRRNFNGKKELEIFTVGGHLIGFLTLK